MQRDLLPPFADHCPQAHHRVAPFLLHCHATLTQRIHSWHPRPLATHFRQKWQAHHETNEAAIDSLVGQLHDSTFQPRQAKLSNQLSHLLIGSFLGYQTLFAWPFRLCPRHRENDEGLLNDFHKEFTQLENKSISRQPTKNGWTLDNLLGLVLFRLCL